MYDIISTRFSSAIGGAATLKQAMRKVASLTPTGAKRDKWAFEWKSVKSLSRKNPPYVPVKKDTDHSFEDLT